MDNYLTVAQVAARTHASERTIRQRAAAGRFPGAIRIGPANRANWLIPPAALRGFKALPRGRPKRKSA